MLRRVALVRTDVSEEFSASTIKRRLLVTANVVPISQILVTLMVETLSSSETWVLTRAIRRNTPEDGILHSHRRENLESYIALAGWALQVRRNVSPVKYLRFYIPEDGILHSDRHENLKSYKNIWFFQLMLYSN
jgi:hypothetical protein